MNTFLVLDLETTGFSPEKGDTIIDIGAIICDETGILKTFQTLVHPGGTEVSDFIYNLTGISAEMLVDAPAREKVLKDFQEFLGDYSSMPVVGHNVQFDCNFLNAFGFSFSQENHLDTNDFSTLLYPEIPSHSLEILSSYFQIEHTEKHRALGDVLASYGLLKILKKKYIEDFEPVYGTQISNLMSKQSWGGRHFFTLHIEDSAIPSHLAATDTTQPSFKAEKAKIFPKLKEYLGKEATSFIAIPSFAEPAQALLHAIKDTETKDAVILGNNYDLDYFKPCTEESQWNKQFLLFDSPSQIIVHSKVKALWEKENLEDAECVLMLRMLLLDHTQDFIPQYALKLTHRERSILYHFSFQAEESEDTQAAFQKFLASYAVIATSYYQYFHGQCSTYLQARSNAVIMGAMCLETNMLEASRKYCSLDVLKRCIEGLETANASQEYMTILQSLTMTLEGTFDKIAKKLSKMQRIQGEINIFAEEIADLKVFTERGIAALRKEMENMEDAGDAPISTLQYFEKQISNITETTDFDYWYYVKMYNNQLTFYCEPKSLESFRKHLTSKKSILLMDSIYEASFKYFLPIDQYYCLESIDVAALINQHLLFETVESEELKSLEKNDIQFFTDHINLHVKTAILCNTGTKLEKIFDTIYSLPAEKDFTVVSFGRTGGTHKVQYMFANAEAGCMVCKFSDFFRLPASIQLDEVMLHSFPFPNIQGMYFDSQYNNTFEAFTIPMTLKCMKEVLYKSIHLSTEDRRVLVRLYDARMYTKDYGRAILAKMCE